MRSIFTLFLLVCIAATSALAQSGNGAIKGRVFDQDDDGGLPFANVVILRDGVQRGGTATDVDGNFHIKNISPGEYTLRITYSGYQQVDVTGVQIQSDKTIFQDIGMRSGLELDEVVKIGYKKPLFEKDETSVQQTLTQDEVRRLPTRSIGDFAATSTGVFQAQEGGAMNFRGARSDANQVFIDGVKVRGTSALPQTAIEQITTVTGGVPAKYGDASGGIINITTRGPSGKFRGNFEAISSGINEDIGLDPYGYNLLNATVSGPIWKKNKGTEAEKTVLGYFVAAEYGFQHDPRPRARGTLHQVKGDVLDSLEQFPLRENPGGSGLVRSAEFLRLDDIEEIRAARNTQRHDLRLSTKFDLDLSNDMYFTFGGNLSYTNRNDFVYRYTLLNPQNNPQVIRNNWRTFGRFTQSFGDGDDEEGGSTIQNAYYSVQIDYERDNRTTQQEELKDDIFNYGYVGRFKPNRERLYGSGEDARSGLSGDNIMQTWQITGIDYEPADINYTTRRYTEQYYDLIGTPTSMEAIQQLGGVVNGQRPGNVYSTWFNTGRLFNGKQNIQNEQFRLVLSGSVDLHLPGDEKEANVHSLEFGMEFEQRVERAWSVSPLGVTSGLWSLMRQHTNSHIDQLDFENPIILIDGEAYTLDEYNANDTLVFDGNVDSIRYNRRYVASDQSNFDKQLRQRLGLEVDGTDWIDVDTISPELFSLDMFTPDELFANGNAAIRYRGYDYKGNIQRRSPSFNDYFTEKDENGNFTRPIDAYRPNYIAAYIQDKFAFRDLIFNVGVRVDRFDANQRVLRDRYSLQQIRSVGDVTQIAGEEVSHPGHIGEDYAVYVNDLFEPTRILGYRDGDTWFDAKGEEITNPDIIAEQTTTGGITPYLANPDVISIKDEDFNPDNSFTDYAPQVNVMPRIAFSFPISDEATFFAHYDILTQRPQARNIASPYDYYYLVENSTTAIGNPNLRPEKIIDYEVGFKQRLTRASALSISGFYREIRDNIQFTRVTFAYPVNYFTFQNLDFGNVKGLTFEYDLRRTRNLQLILNYTLQFAEGTGSSQTTQVGLLQAGHPNLRAVFPLSYDQRHTLTALVDYRFGSGKDYDGPNVFGSDIFANAGANLRFEAGSGVPYTAQVRPTREGQFGVRQQSALDGTINGSRLPWTFRIDANINKEFTVNIGSGDDEMESPRKQLNVNVYLWVANLLNTRNVLNVYSYTGTPDDDGFLTSGEGEDFIEDQTHPPSFMELYGLKVNNPGNFTMPRRVRLGVEIGF